jgi:hypothetical protein
MKHILKSILLSLIFTLLFISGFTQRKIDLKIDRNTGNLTCEGITTMMDHKYHDSISWEIKDSKIKSFEIVAKDPSHPHIFTRSPRTKHGAQFGLRLHPKIPDTTVWEYYIDWKDNPNQILPHRCDPKIAVEPVTITLLPYILGLVSLIFLLSTIVLMTKFRIATKKLRGYREKYGEL